MKRKMSIKTQSKLLVESILDKDPIQANSIFQRLIAEADARRTRAILLEADEDLDLDFDDEAAEEDVDEVGTDEMEETADAEGEGVETEFGGEDDETVEGLEADEADKIVEDIVEINCQINAKMISTLFDKIAEIKNKINALGLDTTSREYLKYDITIQYYADKLQGLQNKTNPGIDQNKVEVALTKIETALKQLAGELGADDAEETDSLSDIDTPEEVAVKNDLADEEDVEEAEESADSEEELEEEPEAEETAEEAEESEDEELEEPETEEELQ
jgi:hypothetical protein